MQFVNFKNAVCKFFCPSMNYADSKSLSLIWIGGFLPFFILIGYIISTSHYNSQAYLASYWSFSLLDWFSLLIG